MTAYRKERAGKLANLLKSYVGMGYSQKDLTVLSNTNDPYLFGDDNGHKVGQWFAEQLALVVPDTTQRIHLRGLHYRLVAKGGIRKPDGTSYRNHNDDWNWLQNVASKAARWLEYVPFGRVQDSRNDPPVIKVQQPPLYPKGFLATTDLDKFHVRRIHLSPPEFEVRYGFTASPRYRIILMGEKSSLSDVLLPLTKQYQTELILPNGEATDTLVYEMADRAVKDGRPAVVLYFSDFDPSGFQMPLSTSRKLQAFRDLIFDDLDIRVYRVALTIDHVHEYDLPSSPLKETEGRAEKWFDVWNHEQTEIDALAALQPELLHRIAEDAIHQFFDTTLANRVREAQRDWLDEANTRLSEHPECANVMQALSNAEAEANEIIDEANAVLAAVRDRLSADIEGKLDDVEAPEIIMPEPYIDESEHPPGLFASTDEFVQATQRLIDFKSYDRRTLGQRPKRARL